MGRFSSRRLCSAACVVDSRPRRSNTWLISNASSDEMVGVENSHRTFHTFLVQPVGSFNVVQLDEITRELACTCMGGRMIQAERLANLLNRALVEQGKPAQPYPTACRVD